MTQVNTLGSGQTTPPPSPIRGARGAVWHRSGEEQKVWGGGEGIVLNTLVEKDPIQQSAWPPHSGSAT
jgi:hypothetical protein